MRSIAVVAGFLVSSLFASSAQAAERMDGRFLPAEPRGPVSELAHVARGVAATGVQVGSYGLCYLALGKEDTCLTVADRAYQSFTRAR